MAEPTVTLSGVAKHYGRLAAVTGVDLALASGECVALVGHNGAGKSTLIKLMLGLIRPSAGQIRVLGHDPAGGSAVRGRAGVSFLPENVAFPAAMTGAEMLCFYARLKGEAVAAVPGLLDRVGLGEAGRRRVGTYSKGMRQRLGLAQALLGTPRVLLLDEPTSGLDPASRRQFYDLIRGLRDDGATVLLSSHALTELEERADRVAVMNRGRLVAAGAMAELRGLVDLPVRILLRLPDNASPVVPAVLDGVGDCRRVNGHIVEITCRHHDKLAVLRRVVDLPVAVDDIEIMLPSLDELYATLMARETAR
ncbi:MAG: ATP-binding cassette domain-containing protein [Azospirillum sp.]|nr:ATP-binding cassette domain-containing protein [Azospirillum sp.]